MARLNVDGDKSIYFEDLGSGDKALILIHGWGMSGRSVGWRTDSTVRRRSPRYHYRSSWLRAFRS